MLGDVDGDAHDADDDTVRIAQRRVPRVEHPSAERDLRLKSPARERPLQMPGDARVGVDLHDLPAQDAPRLETESLEPVTLAQGEHPSGVGRPENDRRGGHHRADAFLARTQRVLGVPPGRDVPRHGLDVDDLIVFDDELNVLAKPELVAAGGHGRKLVVGRRDPAFDLVMVEPSRIIAVVGVHQFEKAHSQQVGDGALHQPAGGRVEPGESAPQVDVEDDVVGPIDELLDASGRGPGVVGGLLLVGDLLEGADDWRRTRVVVRRAR